MIETLLIKSKFEAANLEAMAEKSTTILNVDFAEERFSENVSGGRYLRAKALGLEILLTEGDSSSFPDCNFQIVFEASLRGATGDLIGLADLVARVLARNGMKVVRLLGGRVDSGAVEHGE
jgi:hypothetical protein